MRSAIAILTFAILYVFVANDVTVAQQGRSSGTVRSNGPAPSSVIQVNTRLVQVNVIVHDKKGSVSDLTQDEFTIFDNGKLQKIEVFSVSSSSDSSTPEPALPPDVVSNRQDFGPRQPTVTAILFDIANTDPIYQEYARKQLIQYLQSIQPDDRVALYVLYTGLIVAQDFTESAERLMRAVNRVHPSIMPGFNPDSVTDMGIFESMLAFAAESGEPDPVSADFKNGLAVAGSMVHANLTLQSLEFIARHMAGYPGRKNLVWMSAGFPFTPQLLAASHAQETPLDFGEPILRTARVLNEANVAVYPVDVRGLPVSDFSKNYLAGKSVPLPPLPVPDVMVRIAEATGGKAAYYNNDLTTAVRSAVADGKLSYTIGFYSSDQAFDGKFHNLAVKVKRKNVEVHYHSGYYAGHATMTDSQRRQIMAQLMISPLEASELGLTARVRPDPAQPGKYNVQIRINPSDIVFDMQNDRRVGKLSLSLRLESSREKAFQPSTIPLSLTAEQFQTAIQRGLLFENTVEGTPQDRLRIVIQDQASGLAGSLWIPLDPNSVQSPTQKAIP